MHEGATARRWDLPTRLEGTRVRGSLPGISRHDKTFSGVADQVDLLQVGRARCMCGTCPWSVAAHGTWEWDDGRWRPSLLNSLPRAHRSSSASNPAEGTLSLFANGGHPVIPSCDSQCVPGLNAGIANCEFVSVLRRLTGWSALFNASRSWRWLRQLPPLSVRWSPGRQLGLAQVPYPNHPRLS